MSMKPAVNLIVAALFELPGYFAGIYLGVKCRRKPAHIVWLGPMWTREVLRYEIEFERNCEIGGTYEFDAV